LRIFVYGGILFALGLIASAYLRRPVSGGVGEAAPPRVESSRETLVDSQNQQKPQPLKIESPPALVGLKALPQANAKNVAPDRHPPHLPLGQVFFEVIEGDLAVTGGDILLGKVPPENKGIKNGAFEPPRTTLWPKAEIPFVISTDIKRPQVIYDAIDYFRTHTPVRFVEAEEGDADMIVFVAATQNCASHLGRIGGPQPILVSPDCGKTEIMHELMHALGFVHEHARLDRDQYLRVNWDHIAEEYYPQFNKVPDQWVHEYSGSVFDFDAESIMLYSETAFSKKPGLKSLESKTGKPLAPSRDQLSRTDRERLFYLYGR
jgi:hypothetical protein